MSEVERRWTTKALVGELPERVEKIESLLIQIENETALLVKNIHGRTRGGRTYEILSAYALIDELKRNLESLRKEIR